MTPPNEETIRERAYAIWMATGCENGLAELHWLSAEQAVMDEAMQPGAKGVGKPAKKAAPRAKSALPATVAVRKRAKKEKAGQA